MVIKISYNEVLESLFDNLDPINFSVNFHTKPTIFVCGGPMIDIAQSLRERIFRYFAGVDDPNIIDHFIAAEDFKDYFKAGAYKDLMSFEDDIANISTLVVICLESAGSLVELGLFCNRPELKNRLLVFVPAEEVDGDPSQNIDPYSSFIYLGPLQSLKRANDTSVMIYPWPNPESLKYEHLDLITQDIVNKLETVKKSEAFSEDNTGHLAFLVHDIIRICEPIKISEIELALISLIIDVSSQLLTRLLYLLEKMKMIAPYEYSGSVYYYVRNEQLSKLKFGRTKDKKVADIPNIKMQIRNTFVQLLSEGKKGDPHFEVSKKRLNAYKRIAAIRKAV